MMCLPSHVSFKKLQRTLPLVAISALLSVVARQQAVASPRLARLVSLRTEHGSSDRIKIASLAKASSLTLRIVLPGTGITTIQVRRPPHTGSSIPLMQGHSLAPARRERRTIRFSKRWAAASLADGKKLTLNFATPGAHGATIFYALSGEENANAFRIVRAPHYALANKGCLSSHATADSGTPLSLPLTRQLNLGKNLSISTVADYLWVERYGSSANSRIQTITNSASAIYGRDLGMRISIANQKIDSSPSSYPGSITASERFLSRVSAQESLKGANETVMFTGRDFDSGVIGIAYLGTVCIDPSSSYAAIQNFQDALDPVILAHEIGHTLSAEHDASGIMTTALNPSSPPTSFSATSIAEISSHVVSYGSCLAPVSPESTSTPTPAPTQTPTRTPDPTPTPLVPPTFSPSPSATPLPTATRTPRPTSTATPTEISTPIASPTAIATDTPKATPTATGEGGPSGEDEEGNIDLSQLGRVRRKVARLEVDTYTLDDADEPVPLEGASVTITCTARRAKVTKSARTDSDGTATVRMTSVSSGMNCRARARLFGTFETSDRVKLK